MMMMMMMMMIIYSLNITPFNIRNDQKRFTRIEKHVYIIYFE